MRRAGASVVVEWSNAPEDRYGAHAHPYRKVICCLEGSIAFHVDGRDVELSPGDRLEIGTGTEHTARVGGGGVRCAEAHFD
jgi:quercetin dioxygenase-like cupin family protein